MSFLSVVPSGLACVAATAVLAFPTALLAQAPDTTTTKRECKPLKEPEKLPALAQVIDSAGLLTNLPTWVPLAGQEVILSLAPGSSKAPAVRLLSPAVPPDSARHVADLVRSLLRPVASVDAPSIRIHISSAPEPSARLERSVLCGPVRIQPASGVTHSTWRIPADIAEWQRRRLETWRPTVSLLVGTDGRVVDARAQPSSGIPDVDRSLLAPFRDHRYTPALLDEIPVEVWVTGSRVKLAR